MPTKSVLHSIDEQRVVLSLREAVEKLDGGTGEVVVDLSDLRRIDTPGLKSLDELARAAEAKVIKVVLRGANVDVYKALKLGKLTQRFSFEN